MKLSKRPFPPPLLDIFECSCIDVRLGIFIDCLFISNEKEGLNSEVNYMPLAANSMVDRVVLELEFSSKYIG